MAQQCSRLGMCPRIICQRLLFIFFFFTLLSSTHTHNHTITQTWLHKHPADFQPRPSRSSSFLFCHIYNGAVISCSLEQPAGPGGEPLRRMTLRLRSVCATLHRHAAGLLVLRAFTSVFYNHSERKCFGNSRVLMFDLIVCECKYWCWGNTSCLTQINSIHLCWKCHPR